MRNKLKNTILLLFLATHLLPHSASGEGTHLRLQTARKLKPGFTNQSAALTLLGSPDRKLNLSSPQEEIWMYFDAKNGAEISPKLSLTFEKNSRILRSVTWVVGPDDPEKTLAIAKTAAGGSDYAEKTVEWTNPHSAPDEVFHMSAKTGTLIVYSKSRNGVEAIEWDIPMVRATASNPGVNSNVP
jgi:hypothetical protein